MTEQPQYISLNEHKQRHDIEEIMRDINELYEIMNISKAIFVVKNELYDDLMKNLNDWDFSVSRYGDINKFTNNESRILFLRDNELCNLYRQYKKRNKLKDINLMLFIGMQRVMLEGWSFYDRLGIRENAFVLEL